MKTAILAICSVQEERWKSEEISLWRLSARRRYNAVQNALSEEHKLGAPEVL
jgi:hypothetical protein